MAGPIKEMMRALLVVLLAITSQELGTSPFLP